MITLSAFEQSALLLSFQVSVAAVLGSLPIAIVIAWILARKHFPGKVLLDGLIHLPLVLPPVVVGYFLLLGFGRNGPLGQFFEHVFGLTFAFNWKGAALAAGLMGFPLLVRAIRLSIEAIDPGLEKAARTLGANSLQTVLSVTFPLMLPGLISGIVLAFARALGEFGATITFVANIPGQTQTLPLAIYTSLQSPGGEGPALRLAFLSVLVSIFALGLSEYFSRRIHARFYGVN